MTIDRTDCTAPRHGDQSAYSWNGCRCPDAREKYRLYRKRLREGRHQAFCIDGTGTARRLQSLIASGYSQRRIAIELGLSSARVNDLVLQSRRGVTRATADQIKDLFRKIDGTDGGSRYARTTAAKKGWCDAAAWDNIDDPNETPKVGNANADVVDEVLVERVLAGENARLSPANRIAAIAIGRQRKMPITAIGARLHISHKTFHKLAAQAEHELAG